MSEKKQTRRAPGGRGRPVRRRAAGPADPQRRPLPRRGRALRRRPREVGRARRGRRQPPVARHRHLRAARSLDRRSRARKTSTRSGCAARVLKALKHSSGNYSLILQGLDAHPARRGDADGPVPQGEDRAPRRAGRRATTRPRRSAMSLRDIAKQVIQLMPELPREAGSLIDSIQAPGALADLVAANLDAPVEEKAAAPRDGRREGAHPQGAQAPHAPARDPQDARAHQLPDQGGDGQEPARVRPAPAAQGHQGGARRGRGRPGRPRRARGAHRQGEPPDRGRAGREEAAQAPAQHAGRQRRVHRRAHLPRLDPRSAVARADARQHGHRARCARSSTRTTTASRRSRSASSSTSPSAS